MRVDLLPHNQEAYEKIKSEIADGKRKIAVSHATGTGKSYLIAKLFENYSDDKKIVLVPSTYIRDQIQKLFKKYDIKNADVVLYQKLIKMSDEDIAAMNYNVIALDEYHHDTSKVWGKKVRTLIDTHPKSIIFGTSATPVRSDGINTIDELFEGNCASDLPLSESIAKKIVPLPKYVGALYRLDDELERLEKKVKDSTNTKEEKKNFYKKIKTMRSQIEKAYGMPIILNEHIKDQKGKYLVFCKNKTHLREIKDTVLGWFRTAGFKDIHTYEVYSNYENKDVEYNDFCDDESHFLKLLFCIDMLNEGLHLENISGVLLLRPTGSSIVWHQQIGRAIEANNTNTPVIIDAVNNFSFVEQGIKLLKEIKNAIAKEKESDPNFDASEFEDIDTFFVLEQVMEVKEMFREIEGRLEGKEWTEEEIEILKKYYIKYGSKIKKFLPNKSFSSIRSKASELGLYVENISIFSKEEDQIIKEYYPEEGSEVYKRLQGKTGKQCRSRAKILGIKYKSTNWHKEEDEIIKKYYIENPEIVYKKLENRSKEQIMQRASRLKIRRKTLDWTFEEDKTVIKYYPIEGINVYKRLNGRTKNACRTRAIKLGVAKKSFNKWSNDDYKTFVEYYPIIGSNVSEMIGKTHAACHKMASKLNVKYNKGNTKYVYKSGNNYEVHFVLNGEMLRFGYFKNKDDAIRVAMEKAKRVWKENLEKFIHI